MTRKRIATWMVLLLGLSAAVLALPLLKERPTIPPPPPEEIPPFVLTREFARQNDAGVLRLAHPRTRTSHARLRTSTGE